MNYLLDISGSNGNKGVTNELAKLNLLLTILVIVASSIFPTRPDELIMAVTLIPPYLFYPIYSSWSNTSSLFIHFITDSRTNKNNPIYIVTALKVLLSFLVLLLNVWSSILYQLQMLIITFIYGTKGSHSKSALFFPNQLFYPNLTFDTNKGFLILLHKVYSYW